MDYYTKLKAIVIVSEDNLFVTYCLSSIRTIHEEAFVERVFGKEDFAVLMSELHKEGFNAAWVIIDHETRGEDMILLYKEIEQFKKVIDIQTQVGMNGYHEFLEV